MFTKLPQPVIFAHRGASAHAPENTLAAFKLALDQGAPAIEFDVKLSSDGQAVVIHDQTVDRTTDGSGNVAGLPLAALREFDAGSWFAAGEGRFRGEKIPTLDEVFETVGHTLFMNIELTNYATPLDGLVPAVVKLVEKHGLEEQVLFSSFFPHNLMNAARLLPSAPRGQLIWPGWAGTWQRIWGGLIDIQAEHSWKDDITTHTVKSAHRRGRRVHVWTVNLATDLRRLLACGVDGVFTDDPLVALEILGHNS